MGSRQKTLPHNYHRFIDEAGDMTFYKKGKIPVAQHEIGVSKCFMLGMVKFKQALPEARQIIDNFCHEIENDPYFNTIPSVKKKIDGGGFYLHAKDDAPELRYKFYELMRTELNFSLQAVVGRKNVERFVKKHHRQEKEFYADLMSHLLKDKANYNELVINVAERGSSTRIHNLEHALSKAQDRHNKNNPGNNFAADIKFNVQPYSAEPLLAVADYGLWAVQRVFEKGETRFYDTIYDKVKSVIDLYDLSKYENWQNYYGPHNTLTEENKV